MVREISCMLAATCLVVGCPGGKSPANQAAVTPPGGATGTGGGGQSVGSAGKGFSNANAAAGMPAGTGGSGATTIGSGGTAPSGSGGAPSGIAGMPASNTGGTGGAAGPRPGSTEPLIPEPKGECPTITTGSATIMGVTIQLWTGTKSETQKAPIMIYWHGTGGTAGTAMFELDPTAVSEILGQGGVIASMESGGQGTPLDWGVFTTGDYEIVDQIVACSVAQYNIDTRRIYTSGASAGGLAAGELVYGRSSYMAAANPNSGGQGGYPMNMVLQDPTHVPSVLTMHGARGVDFVAIEFTDSSLREDIDIAKKGGFAVDCDHGGAHVAAPASLKAAGWEFMKAHPFGVNPFPYANGLPANFPSYCRIITKDEPPVMPPMP